ncbi:MAG: long-chain fatty acid--CoA ligase [Gammaproteobacteria bacterium]|nr:long-chain fatty acid--CoA ligase [Gammaproteobacteria bacterium]
MDARPAPQADLITPELAGTLDGLLRERVRRTPGAPAYHYDDNGQWRTLDWAMVAAEVARWRAALKRESLHSGDRVGILMHNRREWMLFDQAALSLGLVVVPLYFNDRPDNVLYVLEDAQVRLLLIEGQQQWTILTSADHLPDLERIISLAPVQTAAGGLPVSCVADWLPATAHFAQRSGNPDDLATIVYTSGTTGRPKGVMLSHRNLLANAWGGLQNITIFPEDRFLSFLPLSHALERTAGYYLAVMCGASVAWARSLSHLAEDLVALSPTVLVSVPRIFERSHSRIQEQLEHGLPHKRWLFSLAVRIGWARFGWQQGRGPKPGGLWLWPLLDRLVARKVRARLGGSLRCVISGGAQLPLPLAKVFIAMGLPLQNGYGLTETSPVVSVNRLEDNDPASVGQPLCNVEVKIGEHQELLVRGPSVMLGYWNNHNATFETIDRDGWLHSGDQARIEDGRIYITGRLKEIIVLTNGEKVPPADAENAIAADPLFEQVMVVGEGRPYLGVLTVLEPKRWRRLAGRLGVDPDEPDSLSARPVRRALLARLEAHLEDFPGYAKIRAVHASLDPWTVENELLTATLKLRRPALLERFAAEISALYAGH